MGLSYTSAWGGGLCCWYGDVTLYDEDGNKMWSQYRAINLTTANSANINSSATYNIYNAPENEVNKIIFNCYYNWSNSNNGGDGYIRIHCIATAYDGKGNVIGSKKIVNSAQNTSLSQSGKVEWDYNN